MRQLGDLRAHVARAGRRTISPTDQVPTTHPVGNTKLTCSCGNTELIDSKKLIEEGWVCSCGKRCVPARGKPLVKEGEKVRRQYRKKGRRDTW